MRTLLVSFFALVISFGMLVPEAEAKRFGGGFSFGKSFSSPKRVQPAAPTKQQAAPTSGTNKAAQPRRGFGGLMGGLLAGGLLGALFFGGAFDGIQFMDMLLIGLLIFVAVKLFSGMKRAQQPQYAGHQRQQPETQSTESETYQNVPPAAGAGFGAESDSLTLPEWFNEAAFVEGAKGHFTHLQQAWDQSDWDDIQTYTTPELLDTLKQERAKQTADQKTEVISVMAELANFIDNDDHVIASINFYGWLKEDSDETTEFSEIWHLRREMSGDSSDWVIVGIQQP